MTDTLKPRATAALLPFAPRRRLALSGLALAMAALWARPRPMSTMRRA